MASVYARSCTSTYTFVLCRVEGTHVRGGRLLLALWLPTLLSVSLNALVQCLILNLSICSVFNPELLHRCVCVRCCSDFLLFLSLMCHHFLWWSCWAGSVVGFHPGWRLSEEAVLPAPKQWSNQPVVKSRSCGAAVLWLSRSIWWHSGFLC